MTDPVKVMRRGDDAVEHLRVNGKLEDGIRVRALPGGGDYDRLQIAGTGTQPMVIPPPGNSMRSTAAAANGAFTL